MTWCGKQGLQAAPNNTFLVDGKNTGNWGALRFVADRGLSYHHILVLAMLCRMISLLLHSLLSGILENGRWQNVVLELRKEPNNTVVDRLTAKIECRWMKFGPKATESNILHVRLAQHY